MQKILCYDVFLGTVNSVTTDSTLWSKIMYSVLLPVLGYGSELWNLESPNTKHVLHQTWRRGFRRGLGLKKYSSLTEALGQTFIECEDYFKNKQLLFFWRVSRSPNILVEEFLLNSDSRPVCSRWNSVEELIQRYIMTSSYVNFKEW